MLSIARRPGPTDQPVAALLRDLKRRGASPDGRRLSELRRPDDPENIGRDHHPDGHSIWLAGGGVKPGQVIGRTDELALKVVEDRGHVQRERWWAKRAKSKFLAIINGKEKRSNLINHPANTETRR